MMTRPYTFLSLAYDVLEYVKKALPPHEIWQKAQTLHLNAPLRQQDEAPEQAIGAQLYIEVSRPDSIFYCEDTSPTRFGLKKYRKHYGQGLVHSTSSRAHGVLKERDLHPFLAAFAFHMMNQVYVKTIFHERSSKNKLNTWLHPDLVGFSFPVTEWENALIQLSAEIGSPFVKFYSFELKRELNVQNLREAFFQTVSNSSWAHYGYLVTAKLSTEESFLEELQRLSQRFGVGVIVLNPNQLFASTIVVQSQYRSELDWQTMNKLAKENPDFRQFLTNAARDVKAKKVYESDYDPIIKY